MDPKTILLQRLQEMQNDLKERDGLLIEEVSEEVEKIRIQADRDIEVLKMNAITNTMKLVMAALDRVQDGEYGQCIECSEDISVKRLNALPWAARCLQCQEKADRREARRYQSPAENGAGWSENAAA